MKILSVQFARDRAPTLDGNAQSLIRDEQQWQVTDLPAARLLSVSRNGRTWLVPYENVLAIEMLAEGGYEPGPVPGPKRGKR